MFVKIFFTFLAVRCIAGVVLREEAFQKFKKEHAKEYATMGEELMRLRIFSAQLQEIERHNTLYARGLVTWFKGVNQFADLTDAEYLALLGTRHQAPPTPLPLMSATPPDGGEGATTPLAGVGVKDAPPSINWVELGAVSKIKNQGHFCQAGWSFATAGAVEGAVFTATGRTVVASAQNLIDCDYYNNGCHNGSVQVAYQYILKNKGIASDSAYPYFGIRGKCYYEPARYAASIVGYKNVSGSEAALEEAVGTVGPVAAMVDATYYRAYKGGIFYEPRCDPTRLNHGVLVVGYDHEGKDDYWLVKNSFGRNWGEQGYMRAARKRDNNCGIASDASYPIVEKKNGSVWW